MSKIGAILIIVVFIIGIILIASPYFPNSEVAKDKNEESYNCVTGVGGVIVGFYCLAFLVGLYQKTSINY